MYSGKTTELLKIASKSDYSFSIFKPSIDSRSGRNKIESHNGAVYKCLDVESPNTIIKNINTNTTQVLIDEVQFFDDTIQSVIENLVSNNIQVIAAGLYLDYRNIPFSNMPELKLMANSFTVLFAKCFECNSPATRTVRLINSDKLIFPGGKGTYEAKCESCSQLNK